MEVVAVAGALLGGGGLGAILAFRKTSAESESISVTTLRGVIEDLREELDRKDKQIATQDRQIRALNSRLRKLEILAGVRPGDQLD